MCMDSKKYIEKLRYEGKNICLSRQEVAFLEKSRKMKGPGSLREDFYTKFKPEN